jgi:hypothetical protein
VDFSHLEILLIESLHISLLIVDLDEVTLLIVFSQLAKQSPEFDPIIAAFDVFQQDVSDVFFEDVESENEGEKIAYFFFKQYPKVMLISTNLFELVPAEHGDIGHELDELPLVG